MACPFQSKQLGRYAVAVDGMDDYPATFTCPHCAQEWGEQKYPKQFKVVPMPSDKDANNTIIKD